MSSAQGSAVESDGAGRSAGRRRCNLPALGVIRDGGKRGGHRAAPRRGAGRLPEAGWRRTSAGLSLSADTRRASAGKECGASHRRPWGAARVGSGGGGGGGGAGGQDPS